MSIIWITSMRLMSFSIKLLMHFCSISTSSDDPQSRPLLVQDTSLSGGPDLKAGAAAHLEPRGSVMLNHSCCQVLTVSTNAPFGQVTLGSLLTMALPQSACYPSITFGFTLKTLSH